MLAGGKKVKPFCLFNDSRKVQSSFYFFSHDVQYPAFGVMHAVYNAGHIPNDVFEVKMKKTAKQNIEVKHIRLVLSLSIIPVFYAKCNSVQLHFFKYS
jgi:hypothetical protein